MFWNRPHKFNVNFQFRMPPDEHHRLWGVPIPSDWEANAQWLLQSGKAYTPTVGGTQSAKAYSKNAAWDDLLDLRVAKYFGRGAAKTKVYLEVKNLLNRRTLRRIDSETGKAPAVNKGNYLCQNNCAYTCQPVSDPSIYGSPRTARLGMGMEW